MLLKFTSQCLLGNSLNSYRRGLSLLEQLGGSAEERRRTL